MSSIIIFAISFSATLSRVLRPLILLKFFNLVGGNIFGTGVTYSVLNMVGQTPSLIEEFITSVTGMARSVANFLNILVGISPGGTDFFYT